MKFIQKPTWYKLNYCRYIGIWRTQIESEVKKVIQYQSNWTIGFWLVALHWKVERRATNPSDNIHKQFAELPEKS